MEVESLLKVIDKVSSSNLNEFTYEEGEIRLTLKKEKQEVLVKEAVNVSSAVLKEATSPALEGRIMKSPLVGTFYEAPSPDEPAFVKPGDTVKKGQVLGIVEAMKLMNEIESEFDGVVEEVLVENEAMVEYGQPLFRIR